MKLSDSTLLKTDSFIEGKWQPADSGQTFTVTNPANGSDIVSVADCGAAETEKAIQAADDALPAWRAKTAKERCNILKKWYQLIMENQDCLLYTSDAADE